LASSRPPPWSRRLGSRWRRRLPPQLRVTWGRPRLPLVLIGLGPSFVFAFQFQPGRRPRPPPAAETTRRPPPKETWYAEPAKVADNLYFLGTKIHSSWAIVGNQGIIVIEALFDYAAKGEILDGLKKLGFG